MRYLETKADWAAYYGTRPNPASRDLFGYRRDMPWVYGAPAYASPKFYAETL